MEYILIHIKIILNLECIYFMIMGHSCIANCCKMEIIFGHHRLLFVPRSDEKERALASNGMHFCLGSQEKHPTEM